MKVFLNKSLFLILGFWGCFLVFSVSAQNLPGSISPRGYVNDYVDIINSVDEESLTQLLTNVRTKTSAEVAVVTIDSTKSIPISEYAVDLFKKWGIGQKEKSNGVLLLVAVSDRAVQIEVGYGLEGTLTDAACSQIIQQILIPAFRAQNYSPGIKQSILAIVSLIGKEYNVDLLDQKNAYNDQQQYFDTSDLNSWVFLLFILLIFFIFFFGVGQSGSGGYRGSGGGYWSNGSGGFGGGFGGFGGGRSGGGGASGRW